MPRLFLFLSLLGLLFAGCHKNSAGNISNEAVFYGTWTKGTNSGDTLWFFRQNGKNMLRVNESFNYAVPNYTDMEYSYHDNILHVQLFGTTQQPISSFTWIEQNKQFRINGYQLYIFMSSSSTQFTFTKLP